MKSKQGWFSIIVILVFFTILSNTVYSSTQVWIVIGQPDVKPCLNETFQTKVAVAAWNGTPSALDFTIKFDPTMLDIENFVVPSFSPFYSDYYIDSTQVTLGFYRIVCWQMNNLSSWDTLTTIGTITWNFNHMKDSLIKIDLESRSVIANQWNSVESHIFGQEISLSTTVVPNPYELPRKYELDNNYPNPFNPSTTISYHLPEKSTVHIEIFNLVGQLIATIVNEEQPAGHYSTLWHGTNDVGLSVASGVYFCRFQAGTFNKTKTLILLK